MAEQPKKPRKVKDLKARLGRTISPNTAKGNVPAPAVAGGGLPAPAVKRTGTGGVPAPSIGRAANPRVAGTPFAAPEPAKPADPFAASAPAAAAGPQEVRLVIDEKPVSEVEVGRKKKSTVFILVGLGAVAGLVVGILFANINTQNRMWNMGARSGESVYRQVRDASGVVTKAQGFVNSAVDASRPGASNQSIDYQAIESLVALENPMTGTTFTQQNYNLFKSSTVADLFAYYQNINTLWSKFATLNARTRGEEARRRLEASLQGAAHVTRPVGLVPTVIENQFQGGLVFVFPAGEGAEQGVVKVATRPQAPPQTQVDKTVFMGGEEQNIIESPDNFVILINNERSVGVLGQQASDFAAYQALLLEIKALMDETMELQGRLEQDLGQLAALDERFALFDAEGETGAEDEVGGGEGGEGGGGE